MKLSDEFRQELDQVDPGYKYLTSVKIICIALEIIEKRLNFIYTIKGEGPTHVQNSRKETRGSLD
jgi:hypothetical protein